MTAMMAAILGMKVATAGAGILQIPSCPIGRTHVPFPILIQLVSSVKVHIPGTSGRVTSNTESCDAWQTGCFLGNWRSILAGLALAAVERCNDGSKRDSMSGHTRPTSQP